MDPMCAHNPPIEYLTMLHSIKMLNIWYLLF
jgi:hypothetical protein